MNNLIFDIGDLFGADAGASRSFHLKVAQKFGVNEGSNEALNETSTDEDFEADITFLKTENAIIAIVENLSGIFIRNCSRCLKNMKREFSISRFEREFFFAPPRNQKNDQDILLVDAKRMEVDLYETFRQEILLHSEAFPVCSSSCRGLCPECGIDKNKAECPHGEVMRVEVSATMKESVTPLKSLKNLTCKKP